jgi:hypothetical protein
MTTTVGCYLLVVMLLSVYETWVDGASYLMFELVHAFVFLEL